MIRKAKAGSFQTGAPHPHPVSLPVSWVIAVAREVIRYRDPLSSRQRNRGRGTPAVTGIQAGDPPADIGPDIGTGAARRLIGRAQELAGVIGAALAAPEQRRLEAADAYAPLRAEAARAELAGLPLDRLKDVARGRLMLGSLEKAGYRTVGDVLAAGLAGLDAVPGVGPQTARQVTAAARQL